MLYNVISNGTAKIAKQDRELNMIMTNKYLLFLKLYDELIFNASILFVLEMNYS